MLLMIFKIKKKDKKIHFLKKKCILAVAIEFKNN